MKINELKSSLTSNKKNKRRGRGAGSGLGKPISGIEVPEALIDFTDVLSSMHQLE